MGERNGYIQDYSVGLFENYMKECKWCYHAAHDMSCHLLRAFNFNYWLRWWKQSRLWVLSSRCLNWVREYTKMMIILVPHLLKGSNIKQQKTKNVLVLGSRQTYFGIGTKPLREKPQRGGSDINRNRWSFFPSPSWSLLGYQSRRLEVGCCFWNNPGIIYSQL